MMRLELEDVLFQLKAAQDELRLAIAEQDDPEACDDLLKIIDALTEVILKIQLST